VLLRHLLSCRSVEHARESLAALSAIGFGAASNVPCADASGEAACFEVAPAGWAEQRPENGVVVHTNHFVCESLLAQQAPMGGFLSSPSRLATAQRHAAQPAIGLPQLKAFLRDQSDGYLSICRGPNPDMPAHGRVESVAGIIIQTRQRRLWIAPGVPDQVEFEQIP
jgi:isopenicillin-N N-acyltransferase-like protein